MSIDDILSKYKHFIFLRETTEEDLWVFYVIREFSEPEDIWMDSVYGFHMKGIDKDGRPVDIYAINLTACYNWEKGYYSTRCLIGTAIHELLHKFFQDEEPVRYFTMGLVKGYRYKKIYLDNE